MCSAPCKQQCCMQSSSCAHDFAEDVQRHCVYDSKLMLWYSPLFTEVGHGAVVLKETRTSSCSSLRLMFHSCWRPCRGPLSTTATLYTQLALKARTIQNATSSPLSDLPHLAMQGLCELFNTSSSSTGEQQNRTCQPCVMSPCALAAFS